MTDDIDIPQTAAEATRGPIIRKVSPVKAAAYTYLTNAIASTLRTPQYLILFVSDKCWMKCSHCWFTDDWKATSLTGPAMSFDEYEKMARSMRRLAFLSMTGGEAFNRPDIVELATMFRKTVSLGRYQIPTSGYKTDMIVRATKGLLDRNPDVPFRVDVSLDGVGEIHERIRHVKGGYARAVETIKELNRLAQRYPYFDVGVITTISKHNQDTIEDIARKIEEIHPSREWIVNIARGIGKDRLAIDVDPRTYETAKRLIEERIARGTYSGHSGHWTAKWLSAKNAARRDIIIDVINGKRSGGGCAAGSIGGVIYTDGSVKVCEMIDTPLGNLRDYDYDLPRIWLDQQARRLRREIQATGCQCTQECFLSVSMLIQPDAWPRMMRERLRLGRANARTHDSDNAQM